MKKQTITLCHGTTARLLPTILKEGLVPRADAPSKWEECPSHPERVYLTTAYAFYFGQNAVAEGEDLLVVEAEVDWTKLVPDEDFLGQSSRGTDWETDFPDLNDRTIAMRDHIDSLPRKSKRVLAESSLANLGTVAHIGKIFPAAIRRIAVVPADQVSRIVWQEHDPTITIANYRWVGEQHRAFQESLFSRFPR